MMRVLICDDSNEARRMLRTVLEEDRNLEIVGEAADGEEAIALGVDLMPDVVLMDVAMPVVDGIEATRRIRELVSGTRVVALAGTRLGALLVAMPASVQLELDEQLVRAVADLAAVSLAQERRLALTFAEARRDALTGLPNRRAFDEQLDRLLEEDADDPVTVTLLDVDGFKTVNDTGGHAAGDEVLATLARTFLRALRANEHVYRIGGDEFAVILPEAEEHDARAAAQRIADELQLAASFGVAVCGADCEAGTLLREADDAMYRMKRRRRAQELRTTEGDDLSAVV
jgi:diguanylate cyclase (GGDEF)-like protein